MIYQSPIVVDNGSKYCRFGPSSEYQPTVYLRNCVAYQARKVDYDGWRHIRIEEGSPKTVAGGQGNFLAKISPFYDLSYPVRSGMVEDWEMMTEVWSHCYSIKPELDSSEHPVLVTEVAKNPKGSREAALQIFFEEFDVPAFYLSVSGVLALYSTGRTNGLVIDSGFEKTEVIPVYEGYHIKHASKWMDLGGVDVTEHFGDLLTTSEISFISFPRNSRIFEELKEEYCYVSLDYQSEVEKYVDDSSLRSSYELPDGTKIEIGVEKIEALECFFKPEVIGNRESGIHKICRKAVSSCDVDLRRNLYETICLCGGNTAFKGLAARLNYELSRGLGINSVGVFYGASDHSINSAWLGGSILSLVNLNQPFWVEREDYDEAGPGILHRMCF